MILESVHPINWDPRGLTITSIQFNNGFGDYSHWVDRVFGSKAIVRRQEIDKFRSFENFHKNYAIPSSAFWSSCSIELLGFARHDVEEPITNTIRFNRPAAGYAYLQFGENSESSYTWKCYYRALHDTWRFQGFHTAPNYWAIFFYCPAPQHIDHLTSLQECDKIKQQTQQAHVNDEYAKFVIQMNLQATNWTHTFHGNLYIKDKAVATGAVSKQQQLTKVHNINHYHNRRKSTIAISIPTATSTAICLVLPYITETQDRRDINGAMLVEFLRYYTLLGMKIFIYDRDGAHMNYIYGDDSSSNSNSDNTSAYRVAQNISFSSSSSTADIIYNDYTIRNYLGHDVLSKISRDDVNYDRILVDVTDEDKTNTLTHCRMEAKVVYNIDQIIVLDFDEFLYCPATAASTNAGFSSEILNSIVGQRQYIHYILQSYRQQGYEQLEFEQRMIAPMSSINGDDRNSNNVQQCILNSIHPVGQEKRRNASIKSIFSCFTSYSNKIGRNRRKSIHLNLSCPLTDFHQACSADYGINNCLCRNRFMYNQCAVVHLTLNQQKYDKFKKSGTTNELNTDEENNNKNRNQPFEILTMLETFYSDSISSNPNFNSDKDGNTHHHKRYRKRQKVVNKQQ